MNLFLNDNTVDDECEKVSETLNGHSTNGCSCI